MDQIKRLDDYSEWHTDGKIDYLVQNTGTSQHLEELLQKLLSLCREKDELHSNLSPH